MTLTHADTTNARHPTPPEHTPRLRLKPSGPPKTRIGLPRQPGRWPYGRWSTITLNPCWPCCSARSDRPVMYNLGEWAKVPSAWRRAAARCARRLPRQPVNTIEVVGLDNARIALAGGCAADRIRTRRTPP
jgi:hypothetical protein